MVLPAPRTPHRVATTQPQNRGAQQVERAANHGHSPVVEASGIEPESQEGPVVESTRVSADWGSAAALAALSPPSAVFPAVSLLVLRGDRASDPETERQTTNDVFLGSVFVPVVDGASGAPARIQSLSDPVETISPPLEDRPITARFPPGLA